MAEHIRFRCPPHDEGLGRRDRPGGSLPGRRRGPPGRAAEPTDAARAGVAAWLEPELSTTIGDLCWHFYFFQVCYRDPAGPCGNGFNSSTGVQIQP